MLYIYSTNIGTEYFKRSIYSPFFPLQNAVCFTILTYLVPVLFIFYIQGVIKFKKIIPAPQKLNTHQKKRKKKHQTELRAKIYNEIHLSGAI
jgi:predicted membrane protein